MTASLKRARPCEVEEGRGLVGAGLRQIHMGLINEKLGRTLGERSKLRIARPRLSLPACGGTEGRF